MPANCSLLCDAFKVNNGCTRSSTKDASKVGCILQDISDCSDSSYNVGCSVQFATPMKVFLLKMNAHLAGCVTKTVSHSSKFACSFINYAQRCARKQAVIPVHNIYFTVDSVSAVDCGSDILSPLDISSHTSTEATTQNIVLVRQCVLVVMTFPRRVWIDYQWYDHLIDLLVSNMLIKYYLMILCLL